MAPAVRRLCSWPSSRKSESGRSSGTLPQASQACSSSGSSSWTRLIATRPTAPMKAATTISSNPAQEWKTSGLKPMRPTPMNDMPMPSQRRQ